MECGIVQLIKWFGDFQVWDSVKCLWEHVDEENFNFDEVDIASKVSSLQIVNGCIVRKLAGILKENVTLREIIRERAIIKNIY